MYCLEANYTTRSQYRAPCTLLHVKYSLHFFSVLKENVAASKPYTVAGRLKTETLDSRSRKRMCKENEALKDFQNMIPEAM